VQEQRLFSAAGEHERVAPLQPRHHFALARLFRQQQADGFLLARFGRDDADVEQFGIPPRFAEEARWNEMIVHDDIGVPQALEAADGHQSRITGTRADQINGCCHG
jgi:hypothetical protein